MRRLTLLLLLLAFALLVSSATQKSPTVDEQGHLFRGVAYVKTGATHFLWGHPLLASALNALPLLSLSELRLPTDEPAWAEGNWAVAGDAFLWRLNPNPQRLIFLGRLATIWLTLLLGALVYRWGRQLHSPTAGLMALALLVLDPNILAHGQLVTSDLPLTFFMVLAVYGYWRWGVEEGTRRNSGELRGTQRAVSREPVAVGEKPPAANRQRPAALTPHASALIIAGMALGAAAATKFNAALLLPALGLLGLWLAVRWRSLRPLMALLLMGLVAWVTVWAAYRLALSPLPGGAFWDDLTWQFEYLSRPHGAYLLGQTDVWGWWYYFPITFLVKTPLPILILLGWAMVCMVRELVGTRRNSEELRGTQWAVSREPLAVSQKMPAANSQPPAARTPYSSRLFLLLPPLTYFAISLISPLNIGYRHLIPLLPFLALFIATTLSRSAFQLVSISACQHFSRSASQPVSQLQLESRNSKLETQYSALSTQSLAFVLTLLLILSSLFAWPDYIPYFNGLVSWSGESWRILSDSNVDWGQDLPALAEWQRANGERLKLSYFGVAHPSAYGLEFDALPIWEPGPEQMNPAYQPFNPAAPAPGLYAISVTHLHGLVLGKDYFAGFRGREPLARIGGSIFIYRVEPTGEPASVAFAGLRPAELDPSLPAPWQTNDVVIRWFDARTSFIWPAGNSWLAVAAQTPDLALQPFWPSMPVAQVGEQALYQLAAPFAAAWQGQPASLGGVMTFLGYRRLETTTPDEISLLTAWQVTEATGQPLKIFVHALDENSTIVGQWDGLDVEPTTWQAGDIIIQLHRFSAAAASRLQVGMYNGLTLERLAEPVLLD